MPVTVSNEFPQTQRSLCAGVFGYVATIAIFTANAGVMTSIGVSPDITTNEATAIASLIGSASSLALWFTIGGKSATKKTLAASLAVGVALSASAYGAGTYYFRTNMVDWNYIRPGVGNPVLKLDGPH